jgi:hypothetical protein
VADGDWKVTIAGTDYENTAFTDLAVMGRENDVSSAILFCSNFRGVMWTDTIDTFDSIQVAIEDAGSYVEVFDGYIREYNAVQNQSGSLATIKCKGLGMAEEVTHCKDMFGYTSNQDSLNTIEEILEDLVDNSINLSYSSANKTGYSVGKNYIQAIDAGLSIPFFNAPYQSCKSIINLICTLDTAYRDGSTAGPHWFHDVNDNLRIKTIGTQQAQGGFGGGDWGIYYGGSTSAVTLTEGVDFFDYTLTKPTHAYANNVVLAFDLRKPAYDYWTEDSGGQALWGNDSLTALTDTAAAGEFVVGSHALKANITFPDISGRCYYPSAENAAWDVTKWGSEANPPTVDFYFYKTGGATRVNEAATTIRMCTTDHDTDYFYCVFSTWSADPDDEWIHRSIPIGPYWNTVEETRMFEWVNGTGAVEAGGGNGVWTTINCIAFRVTPVAPENCDFIIDDLHFSGKAIREAVDTSEVTANNEYQHAIISRTPLDDTAVAATDTGMAGQLCHAELLRRAAPPRQLQCTVPLQVNLKPGEQYSVYLGKTASSYKINGVDFRVTGYTHRINEGGRTTTLTMTDDVLNSFPLTAGDQRKLLNEYLLENNAKATDMQGGDVDLLVPHLRKTY